jgi:acetolactate synthase-1/2/3 large subunit
VYRAIDPAPVDIAGVARIAAALTAARQPVLVVGNKLMHLRAGEDIVAVCERYAMPFTTVDYAKGVVPEDHPLALGVLGQAGHASVTDYLREADLVLLAGVRMTHATTIRYSPEFFKNAVYITDDPREIGRVLPARDGLVGCPRATLRALAEAGRSARTGRDVRARIAELRAQHQVYDAASERAETTPLRLARVFRVLRESVPRDTLIVSDVGLNALALKRHFPVYAADGFYALYAMAAMGSGLPMSLGVQLARPDAKVVSVIGDGGFLVYLGELSVAAQHGLPVVTIVLKDNQWSSVGDRQQAFYGHRYGTTIYNGDYAKLAESFGCLGYHVENGEQLARALERALAARRPTVIEVDVDPTEMMTDYLAPQLTSFFSEVYGGAKAKVDTWPFPRP